MNYKNTPEGRAVRDKYADILSLKPPELIKPRMDSLSRAKIFSPFAALRGYEEEISDQDRVHELTERPEFSTEETNALSEKLAKLRKGMRIHIRFFREDLVYSPLGCYQELTGTVKSVDSVYKELVISTKDEYTLQKNPDEKLCFYDICEINVTDRT